MDAKSIDQTTFDLSVKNPNGGEEVTHRSPEEIMDEIAALDAESAEVLGNIRGAAMKNGWQTKTLGEILRCHRRWHYTSRASDSVSGHRLDDSPMATTGHSSMNTERQHSWNCESEDSSKRDDLLVVASTGNIALIGHECASVDKLTDEISSIERIMSMIRSDAAQMAHDYLVLLAQDLDYEVDDLHGGTARGHRA